ncbi:hypothetical protein AN1V17_43270 [Vallitalea sediminicola]
MSKKIAALFLVIGVILTFSHNTYAKDPMNNLNNNMVLTQSIGLEFISEGYVYGDNVCFREDSNSSSAILGVFDKGERVAYYGNEGAYQYVYRYKTGQFGYVHFRYLFFVNEY